MGMMICGVAACQTLDSSGEVLDMKGLDISTLERDGVFNYEHEEKLADQIVGKILKAKKIFSDADCETSQELSHWQRIQVPFLWVVGELFDDLGHNGAQNVAAMLRYDERQRNERGGYQDGMKPVVNFSIQGGKLHKAGNIVTDSLARKVSITITPCNKVAEAEEYKPEALSAINKKSAKISDTRSFKNTLLKAENIQVEEMRKDENPKLELPKTAHIGTTTTGKAIPAHGHHSNYSQEFSAKDHKEAGNMHFAAASATKDQKQIAHHRRQSQFHLSIAARKENGPHKGATSTTWSSRKFGPVTNKPQASVHRPYVKVDDIKKSDDLEKAAGKLLGSDKSKEDLNKSEQYHTEEKHAKSISDELDTKGKELGQTGASYKFSVSGKGVHGVGFKDKASADAFTAHAKKHPAVHSVKQSQTHNHHLVDVHIKTPSELKKSLDAGSPMGAPGTLTQGAALQSEQIDNTKSKAWNILRVKKKKKIEALNKAETDSSVALSTWEKAEDFKKFLAQSKPNMTKAERDAFAKVFALYRINKQGNGLK